MRLAVLLLLMLFLIAFLCGVAQRLIADSNIRFLVQAAVVVAVLVGFFGAPHWGWMPAMW